MNSLAEAFFAAVVVLTIATLIVLMAGTPDLLDAIIYRLTGGVNPILNK